MKRKRLTAAQRRELEALRSSTIADLMSVGYGLLVAQGGLPEPKIVNPGGSPIECDAKGRPVSIRKDRP